MKTDTLEIQAIDRDCWRVTEKDGDTDEIVMDVQIAGTEILRPHGSFTFEVVCTDWGIEGEYHPSLLIEATEWYSPPE